LPIFASPIRIKPHKIKATGSEIKLNNLLPRNQGAAIIVGGIIDINIGFIISPPLSNYQKMVQP